LTLRALANGSMLLLFPIISLANESHHGYSTATEGVRIPWAVIQ